MGEVGTAAQSSENDDSVAAIIGIVSAIATRAEPIERATPILERGLIDSLNVFHIIAEIENRFAVKIGVMDATLDDFRTPGAIAALVARIRK